MKLGSTLTVVMDRPLGSTHPKNGIIYPINYGYIEGLIGGDGEEQDAYVVGVDKPVEKFTGVLIAVIHRINDVEDKWVVAPKGMTFSKEEILKQVEFQEKYFETELIM